MSVGTPQNQTKTKMQEPEGGMINLSVCGNASKSNETKRIQIGLGKGIVLDLSIAALEVVNHKRGGLIHAIKCRKHASLLQHV
jgi:hypothetical protein